MLSVVYRFPLCCKLFPLSFCWWSVWEGVLCGFLSYGTIHSGKVFSLLKSSWVCKCLFCRFCLRIVEVVLFVLLGILIEILLQIFFGSVWVGIEDGSFMNFETFKRVESLEIDYSTSYSIPLRFSILAMMALTGSMGFWPSNRHICHLEGSVTV